MMERKTPIDRARAKMLREAKRKHLKAKRWGNPIAYRKAMQLAKLRGSQAG